MFILCFHFDQPSHLAPFAPSHFSFFGLFFYPDFFNNFSSGAYMSAWSSYSSYSGRLEQLSLETPEKRWLKFVLCNPIFGFWDNDMFEFISFHQVFSIHRKWFEGCHRKIWSWQPPLFLFNRVARILDDLSHSLCGTL